tara:strand:+ start:13004 stop:13318 length:315 start_codon:yes stop_codon:yes gene_type:complete
MIVSVFNVNPFWRDQRVSSNYASLAIIRKAIILADDDSVDHNDWLAINVGPSIDDDFAIHCFSLTFLEAIAKCGVSRLDPSKTLGPIPFAAEWGDRRVEKAEPI